MVIIGDHTPFKVEHIKFPNAIETVHKEKNIFDKLSLVGQDFFYFNDDHFLLEPFGKSVYHFTGTLEDQKRKYKDNEFKQIIENTIKLYGDIPNYFRHAPLFIEWDKFKPIQDLNWNKPWGYCTKSIYCHINGIKGIEYPDLKFKTQEKESTIEEIIKGRMYFSTEENIINQDMINVLDRLYPFKSKFEY